MRSCLKFLISMLLCLILTFVVSTEGDVMAQTQTPPELAISLSVDKISYVLNGDKDNDGTVDQNDAIKIIVTLREYRYRTYNYRRGIQ